jgi:hypothetical protein
VNTAHGAVLSAAMYLVPKAQTPPRPGGCLTQWHIHRDLCFSGGRVVGTDNNGSCGPGSLNEVTQPMMHVWLTPVSGGPLAPDPPALSEVEAALKMPALSPPNACRPQESLAYHDAVIADHSRAVHPNPPRSREPPPRVPSSDDGPRRGAVHVRASSDRKDSVLEERTT